MARLGDIVKIEASSKQLSSDKFWLLNLDMVEQQTGNIIGHNLIPANALNGSIVQFDSDVVLYSKLRPNLNKVVLPNKDGFATSEMLPLKPDTTKLAKSIWQNTCVPRVLFHGQCPKQQAQKCHALEQRN